MMTALNEVEGVPLIAQVVGLRENPAGRAELVQVTASPPLSRALG